MRRAASATLGAGLVALLLAVTAGQAEQPPASSTSARSPERSTAPSAPETPLAPMAAARRPGETLLGTPAEQTAVVKQYCATCHNDRAKAGNLSLAAF